MAIHDFAKYARESAREAYLCIRSTMSTASDNEDDMFVQNAAQAVRDAENLQTSLDAYFQLQYVIARLQDQVSFTRATALCRDCAMWWTCRECQAGVVDRDKWVQTLEAAAGDRYNSGLADQFQNSFHKGVETKTIEGAFRSRAETRRTQRGRHRGARRSRRNTTNTPASEDRDDNTVDEDRIAANGSGTAGSSDAERWADMTDEPAADTTSGSETTGVVNPLFNLVCVPGSTMVNGDKAAGTWYDWDSHHHEDYKEYSTEWGLEWGLKTEPFEWSTSFALNDANAYEAAMPTDHAATYADDSEAVALFKEPFDSSCAEIQLPTITEEVSPGGLNASSLADLDDATPALLASTAIPLHSWGRQGDTRKKSTKWVDLEQDFDKYEDFLLTFAKRQDADHLKHQRILGGIAPASLQCTVNDIVEWITSEEINTWRTVEPKAIYVGLKFGAEPLIQASRRCRDDWVLLTLHRATTILQEFRPLDDETKRVIVDMVMNHEHSTVYPPTLSAHVGLLGIMCKGAGRLDADWAKKAVKQILDIAGWYTKTDGSLMKNAGLFHEALWALRQITANSQMATDSEVSAFVEKQVARVKELDSAITLLKKMSQASQVTICHSGQSDSYASTNLNWPVYSK